MEYRDLTVDAAIRVALRAVNGGRVPEAFWRIERRQDESSSWWHAECEDARFDRADLAQLVEVCRILNGERRP